MFEFVYDPWHSVRRRSLVVCLADIGTFAGLTDGRHVWLHRDQTRIEKRCALAHELEHVDAGHTGHQSPEAERIIRHRVARRLVPFSRLIRYRSSQEDPHDIAEALEVTYVVLADRMRAMSHGERWKLHGGEHP